MVIINIIIAGPTCSGKTTLANLIKETFEDCTIISQDRYFRDLKDIPKYKGNYLFDSINAFEYSEYLSDVERLLQLGTIQTPRYDISSNRRLSKDLKLIKKRLLIYEGLHTIKILRNLPESLKIFLNINLEICLERRIERDGKLYGVAPSVVKRYFKEIIIPMYKDYIEPQQQLADIIIKEEEDKEWILKKLMN